MSNIHEEFEAKFELLRTEITNLEIDYYAYKTINLELEKDNIYRKANKNPLFWNTVLNTLHSSLFIKLGRLFSTTSDTFSVAHFINYCQQNINIFSKSELEKRKAKRIGPTRIKELREYMEKFPDDIVTRGDFRDLRRHIGKYREIYETNYRAIRDKIFAHRVVNVQETEKTLYSKTSIGELEKMLDFLNRIYHNIRELYDNGVKLDITQIPILEDYRKMIIEDTKNILNELVD